MSLYVSVTNNELDMKNKHLQQHNSKCGITVVRDSILENLYKVQ